MIDTTAQTASLMSKPPSLMAASAALAAAACAMEFVNGVEKTR